MSYVRVQLPLGLSVVTRMVLPVWEMMSHEAVANLSAAFRMTQGAPRSLRKESSCSTFDKTQYPVKSSAGGGSQYQEAVIFL